MFIISIIQIIVQTILGNGRISIKAEFEKGGNKLELFEVTSSQIVLYDVTMSSGKKYNGKIFVK